MSVFGVFYYHTHPTIILETRLGFVHVPDTQLILDVGQAFFQRASHFRFVVLCCRFHRSEALFIAPTALVQTEFNVSYFCLKYPFIF